MEYRSFIDLQNLIKKNLHRIPSHVDCIVGIPRSGMLVATLISLQTNLPLIDMNGYLTKQQLWFGRTKSKNNLPNKTITTSCPLIIDDSFGSGKTMSLVKAKLSKIIPHKKHLFAAIYVTPGNESMVDIYFEVLAYPRIFEWNLMHHSILESSCVDIDGVLCRDPTSTENDDGPKYYEFLRSAEKLSFPSRRIGWLVTSRLVKYKKETMDWMSNNNITFGKLIMLHGMSAEERKRLKPHAAFKAKVYKKTMAKLFIESDHTQAIEIAKLSGKRVLSYQNGVMIWPSKLNKTVYQFKTQLKPIYRFIKYWKK